MCDSLHGSVWSPDNGDGTYTNPIIHGDYSDPDVVRVGSDFYLTASSFNCVPGLPMLHSRDLVNWEQIGYALPRQYPLDVYSKPQHGNGVWAPSIRYHDGVFYIYYGDPDVGIYLVKASNPLGPWNEPLLIKRARGWIDPCPFWDDDSTAYLVHAWAKSRAGFNSILTLNRMSDDGTQILDSGVVIFDGHEDQPTIEGPKLYKRGGYYYVFAPAGGVKTGWQTVLRSNNIYGPYEARVVMQQENTAINGPHQGAWIETRRGESWFLHFQDKGAYGRVVHLQPMEWLKDWPIIGRDLNGDGIGEPVARCTKPQISETSFRLFLQSSDEFSGPSIGWQWQWEANPDSSWGFILRDSSVLRLNAVKCSPGFHNLWTVPNLLLQKFPAPEFVATTKVTPAFRNSLSRAGLIVMGTDYAYLSVRTDTDTYVSQSVCLNADEGGVEVESVRIPVQLSTLYARVTVGYDAQCAFSYSTDGREFHPIGVSFKAKPGKWIGAKVGLFCLSSSTNENLDHADFDWFRVERP